MDAEEALRSQPRPLLWDHYKKVMSTLGVQMEWKYEYTNKKGDTKEAWRAYPALINDIAQAVATRLCKIGPGGRWDPNFRASLTFVVSAAHPARLTFTPKRAS